MSHDMGDTVPVIDVDWFVRSDERAGLSARGVALGAAKRQGRPCDFFEAEGGPTLWRAWPDGTVEALND
ncbi:MAG: hypothetical protein ABSA72_09550 [Nitrososphaerales archaeon]